MKRYLKNLNQIAPFFLVNINSKITISFAIFFFLMGAIPCFSGDYHNQITRRPTNTQSRGVTLACAQCHMMHGTQGALFSLEYFGNPVQHLKLIRNPTVVELCKHCHEGDSANLGAPIIFDPTTAPLGAYVASGGAFIQPGGSFDASCPVAEQNAPDPFATVTDGDKRHDIGCNVFNIPPPGFVPYPSTAPVDSLNIKDLTFWQTTVLPEHGNGDNILSCEFCHDQHGNTNYRNVRPTPYDGSDRIPDGTNGADGTPKATVTFDNLVYGGLASILQTTTGPIIDADGTSPASQYQTSNMEWRSSTDQIAGFCGKCHINFFGAGGDANLGGSGTGDTIAVGGDEWKRHPVGGMTLTNAIANGHADPQDLTGFRVIEPDGVINNDGDEEPFCFTCHRVHGSTNSSNLIYGAATTIGGVGTMIRDTCNQCHNQ